MSGCGKQKTYVCLWNRSAIQTLSVHGFISAAHSLALLFISLDYSRLLSVASHQGASAEILNVNTVKSTQLDILHKLFVQMQISVHFFKKGKQDFRNTNIMCKMEYLTHIHFYNFWHKHLLVLQLFEKSHLSETKKYGFCDSCSGDYLGL